MEGVSIGADEKTSNRPALGSSPVEFLNAWQLCSEGDSELFIVKGLICLNESENMLNKTWLFVPNLV